jgi:hypothetical protein
MRELSPEQSEQLREHLRVTWGIDCRIWYPLSPAPKDVPVLTFNARYWEQHDGDAVLGSALLGRGIEICYVVSEDKPPDHEVETESLRLEYGGTECYYTSKELDWVAYASHENSISVAGRWLVEVLQREWPGCELHAYRGRYETFDLRGTETPRELYAVRRDLCGSTYVSLLKMATELCRSFTLVVRDSIGLNLSGKEVIEHLQPCLRIARKSREWPGTVLTDSTALVYKFEFNSLAAEVLARATDHLYGWEQPQVPEDLCLYRGDDTLFLVSTSHERDSFFCLTPEECRTVRQQLPDVVMVFNPRPDGPPGIPLE